MFYHKILFSCAFTLSLNPVIVYGQSENPESTNYSTDYTQVTNDESPFIGGVFSKKSGGPAVLLEPEFPERPPIITDDDGNSNQLIVLLDLEDGVLNQQIAGRPGIGESRASMEAAVIDALNEGYPSTMDFFSGATQAWHLISQDRLAGETRELLEDDDPQEILQQYIVLSYPSVAEARSSMEEMRAKTGVKHVEMDLAMQFSWAPNDPYFAVNSTSAGYYQWGMHAMNFPEAWDVTKGHGHVGVLDGGLPLSSVETPVDIWKNYRSQFSSTVSIPSRAVRFHGTHVMGIISAAADNSVGVSGGCPTCSSTMMEFSGDILSSAAAGVQALVERGMQVINMSFGNQGGSYNCSGVGALCTAIAVANGRDVLLVAAAGNYEESQPDFPANQSSVLSVGGAQNTNAANPNEFNWLPWFYGPYAGEDYGSNYAGYTGIMAPARSIVSTAPIDDEYIVEPYAWCSDHSSPEDESISSPSGEGDGYGSCTGTSMAAPHISALAGIIRSIDPRLSYTDIQDIIRDSGTHASAPNNEIGSGMARADLAVDEAVSLITNRLTPLFSQYSYPRRDFFYTTVPQMAAAATWGTLRPVSTPGLLDAGYVSSGPGTYISGYSSYPGAYPAPLGGNAPRAEVWIFTTPENPKSSSVSLVPLYRLSWKCADNYPWPDICDTVPNHMDTTYTTDSAGIAAYESVGYRLDGIEGYIYPKTLPQPTGAVKLMRKYNPDLDDHAIFAETFLSYYAGLGYTENSGSDWLGYVYPNSTGNTPAIP